MPTQALPPRQPIDLAERGDSTDDLQNALGSVLGVAANVFIDRPGFVASEDEVDPLSFAVRELTRLNCRRWAGADKSDISARINNYNAGVCGPYLESIDEFPDGGDISTEFDGGQCVGVSYRVSYTSEVYPFQDCSTFGPAQNVTFMTGPLLGTQTVTTENAGSPLCTPAGNLIQMRLGNGQNPVNMAGGVYGATVSNIQISRADNQPDGCGNLEPTYQPPATVTPDTPAPPGIIVNLPGLGDVTVNVDLDPTGNPVFTLPDIGVEFGIELGGGDDDGGGDGGGDSVPPGYQGEPGQPVDVGPGEAADDTDPDRNLVGVLVQTIETPARANQLFNFTETYTKGSYFVYFGGDGGLSLNPEGAIARQDQFYYAPEGANRYRVVPNNGFTIRVTPFYEALE